MGVDGSMWTTTSPVTGAYTTTLTPKNRGTARIAAVRDTSCANKGFYVATARVGGCMESNNDGN